MMTGVVMKVIGQKRFGFIKGEDGKEYFFHKEDFNGFFDDLVFDMDQPDRRKITVQFEVGESALGKGPRARDVKRMDGGVISS